MYTLKKHDYYTLHTVAEEVPHGASRIPLIKCMFLVMDQHNGIGLAANQIGVLDRVIVINVNGMRQEFINPVITKLKGGQTNSKEGCLSFPFMQVTKVRYRQVTVEGFDKDWQPIKRKLKGLAAYCIQHEVDHLNGITIGDKEQ